MRMCAPANSLLEDPRQLSAWLVSDKSTFCRSAMASSMLAIRAIDAADPMDDNW
jgi:hypothetical protein